MFPENLGSRRLLAAHGFREVGVYEKHARLDGVWRDVVNVERLLSVNPETAPSVDDDAFDRAVDTVLETYADALKRLET